MLQQLTVNNYAIAEQLDIELASGMTALTGETGAGKSIMLDALGLAIGDRAETNVVRPGAKRAEIVASFDIGDINAAQQWLEQRELDHEDDCLLRRVISAEGRSRAFINGQPVPLSDCRELGALLVDIHSQHAHQSLLKKSSQRLLLDAFAKTTDLALEVKDCAKRHAALVEDYQRRKQAQEEGSARSQLLRYQLDELEALAISNEEISSLEQEQAELANAEGILAASHAALQLSTEEDTNALTMVQQCINTLSQLKVRSSQQDAALEMFDSAAIQLQEAANELQHHIDATELNPERLAEVEQRLDTIYEVARKHRIRPEELPEFQQQISDELAAIDGSDETLEALATEIEVLANTWRTLSKKLSSKRQQAAKKLKKAVEGQLADLAMANCRFEAALQARESDSIHRDGAEDIEFLITTNPGSAPGPLNKIASGGELSRISLAIQVVTAQVSAVPTVVFDEVDVGIGGGTAEVVGKLLRTLGERSQVLCVTHQAQVASQANQHLKVSKLASKTSVKTRVEKLANEAKVSEVARMMGGVEITESTLAHAREMLAG